MIWPLGGWWPAAVSSLVWPATFYVVGRWGAGLAPERLEPGPFTRLRRWEAGGRLWDRAFGVRRWKDRLPDAGTMFGGTSKRSLIVRGRAALPALRRETIRAERVHWVVLSSTPLHAVWCPPGVTVGMAVFGVAANVPFILIQRSNRARVDRLLDRRRATRGPRR